MTTAVYEANQMVGDLRNKLVTRQTLRDETMRRLAKAQQDLKELDTASIEQCNILFQKMSDQQRQAACQKLEELCTYALQYAISPNYEMRLDLRTLRNKPAAELSIIKKDTGVRSSPLESSGGGIVDILSTALRFITMEVWQNPPIDGPVILDEAYKHVSREYIPLVSSFLKKLQRDFGRQILLCTHNEYLSQVADSQICVTMENGVSIVQKVEVHA